MLSLQEIKKTRDRVLISKLNGHVTQEMSMILVTLNLWCLSCYDRNRSE